MENSDYTFDDSCLEQDRNLTSDKSKLLERLSAGGTMCVGTFGGVNRCEKSPVGIEKFEIVFNYLSEMMSATTHKVK